eukprot:CAMPEP_0170176736 /NCGR_PEP_ID=MMETSP0040_2-20121228/9542_1 /TAXON_ID=641309 /ORGANISM="Lotharella oceanica, Strain CCMP622" /LENGTH=169 /DNA_ID=CAMNT_0010419153 /DNA_START=240 /DNA_END=749 /DNA_ORIENTATION=-
MIDSDGQIMGLPHKMLNMPLRAEIETVASRFRDSGKRAYKRLEKLKKHTEIVDTCYDAGHRYCYCCCSGPMVIFIAIREVIPEPSLEIKAFPSDFFETVKPDDGTKDSEVRKNVFRYCRHRWTKEDEFKKFARDVGLYYTNLWDSITRLADHVARMDTKLKNSSSTVKA